MAERVQRESTVIGVECRAASGAICWKHMLGRRQSPKVGCIDQAGVACCR